MKAVVVVFKNSEFQYHEVLVFRGKKHTDCLHKAREYAQRYNEHIKSWKTIDLNTGEWVEG